jgi:FlaA1/EpsC-like NDP-sugar epimerase
MLSFLEDIFECFSSLLGYLALLIIFAHILTRVFDRKTPVRLDKDSFVVITGACMGIGRQMALDIARRYNSKILVIDRRADLFDQITKEIKEAGGFCECK